VNDTTLFIADLHLNDQQPEIYQRFKEFIHNKARNARALYILGDLFEYYLGDDALSETAKSVCHDLTDLVCNHDTKCYFMAGNRDFLLGSQFASAAHITLLNDPTVIELGGDKIILTHADELCTDDIEYQKVRQQIRSKQWQQWFLQQTIAQRIEFAKQARIKSQQHTQSASNEIMDVNQQALRDLFKQFDTNSMIHGHTHRPAFHNTTIDNKPYYRMVVGDWHYNTSYIEHKNNNFQLITC